MLKMLGLKTMGLRPRLALALGLASAGTGLFVLLGNLWIIDDIIQRADERELMSHYDVMQARLALESQRAAAMSEVVAQLPPVQEAMANGDREALVDLFQPGFAALKADYGVQQFQFHTAPATSFLRVHKPEKFGDDLSSFRKTVVEANTGGTTVGGLEGGVAGLGIRGVVPISRAGAPVGTVEFGLSFGQPFFDQFKAARGVDLAFHLSDGDQFKTFAGTLADRSFFDPAEYAQARGGDFQIRMGELDGLPVAAMVAPVTDFSDKPIGVVEIVMDNSEYVAARDQAHLIAIGLTVFGILVASLGGLMLAGSIARPILAITETMRALAQGNLTVDVPMRNRRDEVGRMAQAVAVFKDNAAEMEALKAEQEELERNAAAEKKKAMDKLVAEFQESVGSIVDIVTSAAAEMEATAASMTETAEQTTHQATVVATAAEEASTNVETVASAAEELSSSVAEISRQAGSSSEIVSEAVQESERTNVMVKGLADAGQKIGAVTSLIQEIAEQTNLLALNATIEAARAGAAGRGFAVVASEVKELASQTSKATEEISGQIAAMQGATGETVNAIESIGSTIGKINGITTSIASAVEEQGAATQEIARNVQQAAEGTRNVSSNIGGVNEAATRTGAAASQVLAAAGDLSKQAAMLRHQVDNFLNAVRAA